MPRKTILIVAGAIVALLVVCGVIAVVIIGLGLGATQPAATVGDSFMGALRDGNYAKAFELCSEDLQKELDSAASLETRIKDGNVEVVDWHLTSRSVTNDQAELSGDVTFTGDRTGTVSLVAQKIGSDWRIAGFHLKEE